MKDFIDFVTEFLLPVLGLIFLLMTCIGVPIVGIAYLLDRTACYQRGEERNIEVVYRFPAGCIIMTSDPDDKIRILSQ